jgi:hypothetical protein
MLVPARFEPNPTSFHREYDFKFRLNLVEERVKQSSNDNEGKTLQFSVKTQSVNNLELVAFDKNCKRLDLILHIMRR